MTIGGHVTDGVERRGLMFVLSSPSGAGKTTLSRMLIDRMPGLRMSVSATTRAMRPGEVDGRDYSFVDKATFGAMVKADQLLEWATVFDNSYGTPRAPVVPPRVNSAATAADRFFECRTRVMTRAFGSPNTPRTVGCGRNPSNAYASHSRRCRFVELAIQA